MHTILISSISLRRSDSATHVRYLRQFVRVTGLGLTSFDEQHHVFESVEQKFAAVSGVTEVTPFTFGRYEDMYSIDLHTRYLTERREVDDQPHIPFPTDVDPNHAMEEARGSRFIRVQDNVVLYSRVTVDGSGTARSVFSCCIQFLSDCSCASHEPLAPSEFKEGDIVEVTGSFMAFPLPRRGEYKAVFCMRSLSLIESMFREVSGVHRNMRSYTKHSIDVVHRPEARSQSRR